MLPLPGGLPVPLSPMDLTRRVLDLESHVARLERDIERLERQIHARLKEEAEARDQEYEKAAWEIDHDL